MYSNTVNVDIFEQYVISCISRMALDAPKYDVGDKLSQNSIKRINCYLREKVGDGKMPPMA